MSTLGCATNLIEYVGNGTQTLYTFPFTYLESSDIYVELYDFTTRTWSITTEWTFQNATTIQFNTAPEAPPSTTPDYPNIIIFRRTNVDSIKATFYPGSAIRAEDLNDNFEEILFGTQETECRSTVAKTAAYSAANSAADAVAEAEAAVAAAEVATTVAEASAADAAQAVSSANTAITTANAAVITADSAVSTANTALTTSQTAETSAAGAQAAATTAQAAATTAASAASSAQSDAATASTAALNAEDTADSAVVTANNALSTAQTAISTANTADGKADTAISTSTDALATANSAAAAVGDALLFEIVPDVAAIPASPDDNDSVEVTNSTGIESFSPLTGLPSGFIGDPGINVDIRYVTDTWQFLSYSPNDPDNRYAGPNTGVGSATLPSIGFSGDRDTGIYHPSDGAVAITSNGTAVSQTDSNGIKIGGAVPSSPNISLGSSGSASFAGAITLGGGISDPNGSTYYPSSVDLRRDDGGAVYNVYSGGTSSNDLSVQINSDGSATFSGAVEADGGHKTDGTAFSSPVVIGQLNGTTTSLLRANGDLLIAGDVGNNPNILLSNSGSATFVGDVNAGARDTGATDTRGVRIAVDSSNGGVYTQAKSSATPSSVMAFQALHGTTEKFKVLYDGSAAFAGKITSVGFSSDGASILADRPNADDVCFLARENGNSKARIQADGTTMIGGTQTGSTLDPNITLNADGSATFAGGVNSSDLFRVYATPENQGCFIVNRNNSNTVVVYGDGSAEFGGRVTASNAELGTYTSVGRLSTYGPSSSAGSNTAFSVDIADDAGGSNQKQTVNIRQDGSATFAGLLTSNGDFFGSPIGNSVGVTLTGSESTSATAFRVMPGAYPSTESITFGWDGSAEFAGGVSSLNTISVTSSAAGNATFQPVFQSFISGNGTPTIAFGSNGDATFAGKVTSATTISSDAGTTLATKDYVDATGVSSGASAWAHVASDGSIVNGLNTASCTKTGTGTYTVTWATPMPNADYSVQVTPVYPSETVFSFIEEQTATYVKVRTCNNGASNRDTDFNLTVFATNATLPSTFTSTQVQTFLDLGDTITTMVNRVSAIESGNIIDDATDSSLIQLIASLAARVTALEGT